MIPIPTGITSWFRTGSSYTCDPPVENTDYDIVGLCQKEHTNDIIEGMKGDGWELGGSRGFASNWWSLKKKHEDGVLYNIILTDDLDHFEKLETATALAKKFNLLKKDDRVMLFNAVVDGILPVVLEGESLPCW